MNRQKWTMLVVVLVMICGTAVILTRARSHQKLGAPGVTCVPLEGIRMKVTLPETVLDYKSEEIPPADIVVKTLPPDTSYGTRRYTAPDGFWTLVNVVMMGTDRTSLHKPEFCLAGQGWVIDDSASRPEVVRVERPFGYDLPVVKFVASQELKLANGSKVPARALYVYWFVAEDRISGDGTGLKRMAQSAWHLISTGELQRWSYVSFFAVCAPGQEDATFERMKQVIAASVPEFQLAPKPKSETVAAK